DDLLELLSEARNRFEVWRQHAPLRAPLHSIAADELRMALTDIAELRNVDSVGAAVVEVVRVIRYCGNEPAHPDSIEMVHQIVAERPGGIAKPGWMFARGAVEQQPSRLYGRGAEHDHFAKHLLAGPGDLINERDTLRLAGVSVDYYVARDGVRPEGHPPGLRRGRKSGSGTAEIRASGAASIAMAAKMALRAAA